MSIQNTIDLRGKVVYWTLGNKTDAVALKAEFESQGLLRFAPDKNSNTASLKIALQKVCGSRRRLVRPLPPGERGYAVVTETKDAQGKSLDHSVDFDAVLPDGAQQPIFRDPATGEVINPAEETKILHQYFLELDRCSSHKLGISIVRLVDHFHGISLRPTGGLYWLPEQALSRWDAAAKAIEGCSGDSSNIIYSLRTAVDDRTKQAIISGLSRELNKELAAMEESIMSDDLGKKALETKQARCEKLRKRVTGYQKMFKVGLQSLDESLERVESAVSITLFQGWGV
tara:strand:+ start:3879 stop:4736 length:858 start_codon:yes stop_codon:yes gene_type:complete